MHIVCKSVHIYLFLNSLFPVWCSSNSKLSFSNSLYTLKVCALIVKLLSDERKANISSTAWRHHAIVWAKVDSDSYRYMVSVCRDELT